MRERLKDYWVLPAQDQDLVLARRYGGGTPSLDPLKKIQGKGNNTFLRKVHRVWTPPRSS